jgi:putative endonuclease
MTGRRSHNQRFGAFGEDAVAQWYRSGGYEVLDRNWRCSAGELDLVAASDAVVIFVEVKARSSGRFGSGAEAVDWRKQKRLRALALQWLRQQDRHYPELRFDVVDVDQRGHIRPYLGCF